MVNPGLLVGNASQDIVNELMRIRRNKLPFFQRGMRAMSFIISMF